MSEILDLIRKTDNLPSLPGVAVEILRLTKNPDSGVNEIAAAIEKDPALSAKVLKVVNSAMFALPRKVTNIRQGVSLLGTRSLKVIALSFSLVDVVRSGPKSFDFKGYWTRALCGAVTARLIARPDIKNEAFVAGLLMDIGIMAGATAGKKLFKPVLDDWKKLKRRDVTVELRHLGITHAEMSRELLVAWGLPDSLTTPIGAHLGESKNALARLLRAASSIAGLFCGDYPPGELDAVLNMCSEWTSQSKEDLNKLLPEVKAQVKEMAGMLSLKIADITSYDKLRNMAAEELARLSLQTEGSVAIASRRQRKMLPSSPPEMEGLEFGVLYEPAEKVSGDFYDFIRLKDGRLVLFIGDCTGHGIEASVIMGVAKKVVQLSLKHAGDVGEGLRAANADLHPDMEGGTFASVFAAIYNPADKTLQHARAGHNPTFLIRDNKVTELPGSGMPVGMDAGGKFDEALAGESMQLQAGDILFLYTDGITEAQNADGEEYGPERLAKRVEESCLLDPYSFLSKVLENVNRFCGGKAQEDDITMISLKILE